MAKASEIKKFFHKEGIHSTTIQLEFENPTEPSGSKCMMVCTGGNCADMTCCKVNETTTSIDAPLATEDQNRQKQEQITIEQDETIEEKQQETIEQTQEKTIEQKETIEQQRTEEEESAEQQRQQQGKE